MPTDVELLDPAARAFGRLIRDHRLNFRGSGAKMSQTRLAAELGVTQSYISKVERGEVLPTVTRQLALVAELQIEDEEYLAALRAGA